jgi:excisionase family DNA binding protein
MVTQNPPRIAGLHREILAERLRTPLTTQEAARILNVSRPTLLKWIAAGLLPEAADSRSTKRLLDTESVFRVRQVLDRVRVSYPRREGGEWFRRLVEELFWAAHPDERSSLMRSLAQADAGETAPFEDEAVEAVRRRREEAAGGQERRAS